MIKRLDATYAVTAKLRELFPDAKVTEKKDKIVGGSKDCFYVYSRNSLNTYYNRYYNQKLLDVVINFLPSGDETDYMNKIDIVEDTFSRYLKINGCNHLIENMTTQQMKDSHGDYIVFILSIPYLDGALGLENNPYLMGGEFKPRPTPPTPEEEKKEIDEMMKKIEINYRKG